MGDEICKILYFNMETQIQPIFVRKYVMFSIGIILPLVIIEILMEVFLGVVVPFPLGFVPIILCMYLPGLIFAKTNNRRPLLSEKRRFALGTLLYQFVSLLLLIFAYLSTFDTKLEMPEINEIFNGGGLLLILVAGVLGIAFNYFFAFLIFSLGAKHGFRRYHKAV